MTCLAGAGGAFASVHMETGLCFGAGGGLMTGFGSSSANCHIDFGVNFLHVIVFCLLFSVCLLTIIVIDLVLYVGPLFPSVAKLSGNIG
ncbi:hypothetical protein RAA17_16655 [Komagataeibacter rhaeticus]|nr:hypothetical protein [Komagataeibacter rhaeticus]